MALSDAVPAELTPEMTLDVSSHRRRLLDALPDDGLVILFAGQPLLRTAEVPFPLDKS